MDKQTRRRAKVAVRIGVGVTPLRSGVATATGQGPASAIPTARPMRALRRDKQVAEAACR